MKLTTNLHEKIKLENTLIKANRLCKLNKCNLLDLIVLSIDEHSKELTNNKK